MGERLGWMGVMTKSIKLCEVETPFNKFEMKQGLNYLRENSTV